jgi:hypothetical protein
MSRCRFGGKNISPAVLYGDDFLPGTFVFTKELVFNFFEVRNSKFQNQNSDFLTLQTSELDKNFLTGIFGIVIRTGILFPMGVPEIGTKNRNFQPLWQEEQWQGEHTSGEKHHTRRQRRRRQ